LVLAMPIPPSAIAFDTGLDTYAYAFQDIDPQNTRGLGVMASIANSGIDRIYQKGDALTGGVEVFESHAFRQTFTADSFALGDATDGGLGLSDLETGRKRSGLANEFQFTIHPVKIDGSTVVLYTWNTSSASASSIPPAGGTITLYADYKDPNQLAQSVAALLSAMVAPVATTDYTFNSAANGSGTDLTASVVVTVTFWAKRAKVVITNNHATLAAYPTFFQLRGKGIYSYQALTTESVSAALQATNGPSLVSMDQPYQSILLQAQTASDYFLALMTAAAWSQIATARAFCPNTDQVSMWTLLNGEVSTPFAITEQMAGFMNYPVWINGGEVEIDERDNMTFTFYPEPRDPNTYWALGVAGRSELGTTTYLGPF